MPDSASSSVAVGSRRLAGRLCFALALLVAAWWGPGLAGVSSADAATLEEAEITEFLASNEDGLVDEDGDRLDWIEIRNPTSVSGNLDGWFLTDDPTRPTRWRLPAVELASGGHVVVFASGKDRAPAGADAELHASFRLQREEGGYLALVKPDGITVASEFAGYPEQLDDISYGLGAGPKTDTTLVAVGDTTRWHVPAAPVPSWAETAFDDSGWSAGATGIGYDSASTYAHLFGEGGDVIEAMRGINPTIYIRIPFQVDNPAALSELRLRMKWEDGFVAHLNGQEIHRERAPAAPAWNSASDPPTGRDENDAQTFFDYAFDGDGKLVAGTNVLAIQGLNQGSGNSDFLIVPELVAAYQDPSALTLGFFTEPTPGELNGTGFAGIVRDTQFSVDRGFYESPFEVEITTATDGAQIRFTTDGTRPSETSGTLYEGPITVSGTTVLRAIAYRAGYRSTNVDTHTYVFPADVVTQPRMRTAITQDPVYGPRMIDSLEAVPSFSLALENPNTLNTEDERPLSIEMLFPDGESGFQEDAGVTYFGGYFTNFAKKNFRIYFRREFGAGKLNFPLFDGFESGSFPPVDEFDSFDLRTGSHDMVERGAYMSNRFTDDSMLEMGQIAPHGRFVHVYLNGEYWGQYHLRERWSASMMASYLGGDKDDYEAINANNTGDDFLPGEVYDGTGQYWAEARTLVTRPNPFENVQSHIDLPNVIDFMLLWLSGNSESEFRSAGSIPLGIPFKFFIKDADGFLRPPGHSFTHSGPIGLMARLRAEGHPDYRILVADRIHRHFFNDGALTPGRNIARLQRRVDEARLGFLAEAARWNYRSPSSWESYQTSLINNHFPNLTRNVLTQFRNAGLYPDLIAPVFSRHGGSLAPGEGITMSTNVAAIHYTLDGSDPRLPGGAVNPAAIAATFVDDLPTPTDFIVTGDVWKFLDDGSDQGVAWRAPDYDDSSWGAGPSELGYGETDEATTVGFIDTDPVAAGPQRNATTYFRRQVALSNPQQFSHFVVRLRYDDAAAVHVNGTEVVRTSNLQPDAAFDTFATSSTPSETTFFDFDVPSARFVDGINTIAVEIHQASAGSSDISFDLVLRGEVDTAHGDNVTEPVTLAGPGMIKARARNPITGEWSALNEAFFSIDSVPADASNFIIAELHYHPAEPSTPAEIAESTDRDDFEFVEFLNTGSRPIDLTGLVFTDAISFVFPSDALLEPGARGVIVRDFDAFTARYGSLPAGAVLLGEYSGRLSNDGERLGLAGAGEAGMIVDFTYNDQSPWPTIADGGGYSLVFDVTAPGAEASNPARWQPHALVGGRPGAADSTLGAPYLLWKNANNILDDLGDADDDGLPNLVEYALGTPPRIADTGAGPLPGLAIDGDDEFLTLTFQQNPDAADVALVIEASSDLSTWTEGGFTRISETANPDGSTVTVVWRSNIPRSTDPHRFVRLSVRFAP